MFLFFSFSLNFLSFLCINPSETVLISNNRHSINLILLELIDRKQKDIYDEKNNTEKDWQQQQQQLNIDNNTSWRPR